MTRKPSSSRLPPRKFCFRCKQGARTPRRCYPILRHLQDALGAPRAIAFVRLRHALYDSFGWIAERHGER